MKNILLPLLFATFLASAAKLQIITSVPDIADIVREIGGDRVKVKSLAAGREDLHAVPVRPSFLPLLNRADILMTFGLDAEHAWLPELAASARNPKIMEGQKGWVELRGSIEVLQVPQKLSRSEGEQHPEGNPHYNIGPQSGTVMAAEVYRTLLLFDGEGADYYTPRYEAYRSRVEQAVEKLRTKGAFLKGKKVIAYHEDMAYLCDFYGMEQIGTLEPKPGVPPTAGHLRKLEDIARSQGAQLIIHNQTQPSKLPQKLATTLQIPVVQLANLVGAQKGINTWLQLQEYNLAQLSRAFHGK